MVVGHVCEENNDKRGGDGWHDKIWATNTTDHAPKMGRKEEILKNEWIRIEVQGIIVRF